MCDKIQRLSPCIMINNVAGIEYDNAGEYVEIEQVIEFLECNYEEHDITLFLNNIE